MNCRMSITFVLAVLLAVARGQSLGTARALEQAGQFEQALGEYRGILEKNPRDLAAFQGFVRVCRQLARFDSLEAVSARLRASFSDVPEYALGQVEGLLGLKRRKEAMELGRRLVGQQPDQALALAELWQRWREFGEATNYLLLARPTKGVDPLYTDRLLALLELQNRYGEATKEIVELVNQRPELLSRYLGQIRTYSQKVPTAQLVTELGRIKHQKARVRAQAEVYLGIGKELEAVKTARQGMDRSELYRFARECEGAGALQAALTIYQEQQARADQARVLRQLGRHAEALALLAQEQRPESWFELAELKRLQTGNLAEAAKMYERVLQSRPQDEPAGFGLASCQVGMGLLEPARRTLAVIRPQTDRVLLLTAEICLYRQMFDSVAYFARQILRQYPDSPLANDALEFVLLSREGPRTRELAQAMYAGRTGNIQQALAKSEELGRGEDDVAELAWFLRARLLRESRQPRQAVAVLDSFALVFPQSSRRPRQLMEQADLFLRELGNENKYREMLEQVALLFPGSAYAPLARSLLAEANRPAEPGVVR